MVLKKLIQFIWKKIYNYNGATWLPTISLSLIVGRRLMTIEWAIGQYNINVQRFKHDMVSIRFRWQGRNRAWLIDTQPRMVSITTDSLQRNATVIAIAWPSVSESVLRVRLGVTGFCTLALPRVTLGITAKEVKCKLNHCTSSSSHANLLSLNDWKWMQ